MCGIAARGMLLVGKRGCAFGTEVRALRSERIWYENSSLGIGNARVGIAPTFYFFLIRPEKAKLENETY